MSLKGYSPNLQNKDSFNLGSVGPLWVSGNFLKLCVKVYVCTVFWEEGLQI